LQKHLGAQRKTKKWLTAKLDENEGRTDLRDIFIPAEAISTPIMQSPVKKIEKSSPPPSKRAKTSPIVEEVTPAEDSSSSESERLPFKE
jgi:hypothetical protein